VLQCGNPATYGQERTVAKRPANRTMPASSGATRRDNRTMQFDPKAAKEAYSELPTDELVRIAFLDNRYVAEAKKLAEDELGRRKFPVDQRTLEQVRTRVERQRDETMERDLSSFETEDEMPSWRRSVHRRLAPYRTPLILLLLGASGLVKLDSIREWGLLGLEGRKSNGLVMLMLLIGFVFLMPSREEAKDQIRRNAE